ncbi:GGDEF domain-containing protein [Thiomicrorhabdus sp. 6S2-11]|uniref:diguanylate cyclase n=1 Tax=Thiomicrorhabdus marina TaxID=2818442 RepID=A0ABS3Q752_9GAMM|nr:sensor domain-containing diguanylate cyclase [Thiomicrorhabdus marina]MBO1928152.1 GGDEF domain-containing protein [Thiomicrorhabdus marina]
MIQNLINWTKEHDFYQQQVNLTLLRFMLIIASPILLIIVLLTFFQQQYSFAIVSAISLVIVLASLNMARNQENDQLAKNIALSAILIPYITTLFYLSPNSLGFLWITIIPIIFVFINTPRELAWWLLLLASPLIALMAIDFFALVTTNLSYHQAANTLFGFMIEALMLAYIKQAIFNDQLELKYKNRQLEFNKQLIDQKVPIISLDLAGKITNANNAFMEITGYRKMALIGKTLNQLEIINASLDELNVNKILKNKSWTGELHGHRRSGAQFWMQITLRETFNSQYEKIGYMAICEDITSQQLLMQHANNDQLTGALNRRVFDQFIQKAVFEFQRYREPFSLIICDIDHFKKINDNFGHNFGDEIIKQLHQELTKILRSSDSIARWGGEEFAILLPKTGLDVAVNVAEKVREYISNAEFVGQYPLTISIGVSELRIEDKAEDWFDRADKALYHAKESGRNRVSFTGQK